MVVVFDLDDTLYDESTFLLGGLQAVSAWLNLQLGIPEDLIFKGLQNELKLGRDHIFNRFLERYKLASKKLVAQCVGIYRRHEPHIELYPEAKICLKRLKKFPLYVVTDGNKLVQRRKCESLQLDRLTRGCFCTSYFGLRHSKPSPYCFLKICEREKVLPSQVVYVGDNPYKDFVGIKPLGFHTIRVMTGRCKDVHLEPIYEAEMTIPNLNELNESLLHRMGLR